MNLHYGHGSIPIAVQVTKPGDPASRSGASARRAGRLPSAMAPVPRPTMLRRWSGPSVTTILATLSAHTHDKSDRVK
jgi:hypothetical protein